VLVEGPAVAPRTWMTQAPYLVRTVEYIEERGRLPAARTGDSPTLQSACHTGLCRESQLSIRKSSPDLIRDGPRRGWA
jgi:hypothetical protein